MNWPSGMSTRPCLILYSIQSLLSTLRCSRPRHPRWCNISLTEDLLWYLPVTHLAARLCTFSTVLSDLPTVLLNTASSLFWRSSCVPYLAGSWMLFATVDSLCSCSNSWLLSPSVFFSVLLLAFYLLFRICFVRFPVFQDLFFSFTSRDNTVKALLWQ